MRTAKCFCATARAIASDLGPLLRVVEHKHRRSDLSAAAGVTIPATNNSNVG
jgi:hypothetical protein